MSYKSIKIIFFSYLIVITVGTLLLLAPFSHIGELSFIDALFTSASATCVTGLIVKSTSEDFTFIGELIILLLIQIGGIGYMSMVTLIFLLMKKELNIEEKQIIKESLAYPDMAEITKFLKRVFKIVLAIEGVGVIILSIRFMFDFPPLEAIWFGVFHSVSAFNNAGFSLFTDSIMSYKSDFIVILTISSLVTFGGIGYLVITDLYYKYNRRSYQLSLHSKISLIGYGFLTIFGMFFFLSLEWNGLKTFGEFNLYEKFLNSLFLSVNFRTSGFNSIDIGALSDASLFFGTIFMFIGGGVGGTAGGIKVTTFAVLVIAIIYTIKESNQEPNVYKRTIPAKTINKALAIFFTALLYIMICTMILTETQHLDFLKIFFEVVSAFGTVGVSTGDGNILSFSALFNEFGKVVVIFLMLAGRVGILAFFIVIIGKSKTKFIKYPQGRILL